MTIGPNTVISLKPGEVDVLFPCFQMKLRRKPSDTLGLVSAPLQVVVSWRFGLQELPHL